jgi:acetoin utilization protein AcuB
MNRADLKREQLQRIFQDAAGKQWSEPVAIRAIMTPHPFCVSPQHTAAQIVDLFHTNRFRHFLVADGPRLVGVISDRDVIRLFGTTDSLEPEYLQSVTVGELMSTDLITISADATLGQAATLIIEHGINCLPVVADGQAIGILTSTDLFLSLEQVLKAVSREPTTAGV